MDSIKLKIKFGALDIEYDGPQSFLESGLLTLCEDMVSLDIPEPKNVGESSGERKNPPSWFEKNVDVRYSGETKLEVWIGFSHVCSSVFDVF